MNIQTKKAAADKLRDLLTPYCGSETFYRHPLNRGVVYRGVVYRGVVYTQGVQCFAENAGNGAYWLLDILATEPAILKEARDFAHVTLSVGDDDTAILSVTDGGKTGDPILVFIRKIDYTDCPPGTWEFFFENMTIMLPGER